MLDLLLDVVRETWLVTAQMAGWLLLGFLVAGALSVAVAPAWLERHLGGRGPGPVVRAALFGVPLPLCSCGVIPVAASLRAHGASRAATTSFLLSTPQTGVDSIAVTYTMLGPLFAVFRPVIALVTGLLGGGVVQATEPPPDPAATAFPLAAPPDTRPRGAAARLRAALRYGLVTLPGDIARALLVGVVIAGALGALVPADFLGRYLGGGALAIALMMVAGIPIYVCATASVPLAAGFIHLGATPGAALAFLVAGPATNAATLTTVLRVLGRRTAAVYLATVAASAWGGGLLLDWLLPRAADALPALGHPGHAHGSVGWLDHVFAVVLAVVMTHSWWRARRGAAPAAQEGPRALDLVVEGMHCSHCVAGVERAVREQAGVEACTVSLQEGRARVAGRGLDADAIVAAIDALGFPTRRA